MPPTFRIGDSLILVGKVPWYAQSSLKNNLPQVGDNLKVTARNRNGWLRVRNINKNNQLSIIRVGTWLDKYNPKYNYNYKFPYIKRPPSIQIPTNDNEDCMYKYFMTNPV